MSKNFETLYLDVVLRKDRTKLDLGYLSGIKWTIEAYLRSPSLQLLRDIGESCKHLSRKNYDLCSAHADIPWDILGGLANQKELSEDKRVQISSALKKLDDAIGAEGVGSVPSSGFIAELKERIVWQEQVESYLIAFTQAEYALFHLQLDLQDRYCELARAKLEDDLEVQHRNIREMFTTRGASSASRAPDQLSASFDSYTASYHVLTMQVIPGVTSALTSNLAIYNDFSALKALMPEAANLQKASDKLLFGYVEYELYFLCYQIGEALKNSKLPLGECFKKLDLINKFNELSGLLRGASVEQALEDKVAALNNFVTAVHAPEAGGKIAQSFSALAQVYGSKAGKLELFQVEAKHDALIEQVQRVVDIDIVPARKKARDHDLSDNLDGYYWHITQAERAKKGAVEIERGKKAAKGKLAKEAKVEAEKASKAAKALAFKIKKEREERTEAPADGVTAAGAGKSTGAAEEADSLSSSSATTSASVDEDMSSASTVVRAEKKASADDVGAAGSGKSAGAAEEADSLSSSLARTSPRDLFPELSFLYEEFFHKQLQLFSDFNGKLQLLCAKNANITLMDRMAKLYYLIVLGETAGVLVEHHPSLSAEVKVSLKACVECRAALVHAVDKSSLRQNLWNIMLLTDTAGNISGEKMDVDVLIESSALEIAGVAARLIGKASASSSSHSSDLSTQHIESLTAALQDKETVVQNPKLLRRLTSADLLLEKFEEALPEKPNEMDLVNQYAAMFVCVLLGQISKCVNELSYAHTRTLMRHSDWKVIGKRLEDAASLRAIFCHNLAENYVAGELLRQGQAMPMARGFRHGLRASHVYPKGVLFACEEKSFSRDVARNPDKGSDVYAMYKLMLQQIKDNKAIAKAERVLINSEGKCKTESAKLLMKISKDFLDGLLLRPADQEKLLVELSAYINAQSAASPSSVSAAVMSPLASSKVAGFDGVLMNLAAYIRCHVWRGAMGKVNANQKQSLLLSSPLFSRVAPDLALSSVTHDMMNMRLGAPVSDPYAHIFGAYEAASASAAPTPAKEAMDEAHAEEASAVKAGALTEKPLFLFPGSSAFSGARTGAAALLSPATRVMIKPKLNPWSTGERCSALQQNNDIAALYSEINRLASRVPSQAGGNSRDANAVYASRCAALLHGKRPHDSGKSATEGSPSGGKKTRKDPGAGKGPG
jgi:hypothetical protein